MKITTIVQRLSDAVHRKEDTLAYWDNECVDDKVKNESFGMALKYLSTGTKIVRYLCTISEPNFRIERVDNTFVESFSEYLNLEGLKENTVHFHLRNFSAMYHRKVRDYTDNPFSHVNMRSCATRKRAFDKQTMLRIKVFNLKGKVSLEFARDLFLFSFYTQGMSFVDIAYLKKSDIKGGTIRYKRRKTGQPVTVALVPEAKEIMRRYKCKGSYVFSIIVSDDPKTAYKQYRTGLAAQNRRLKKIGRMLGLDEPLTTYIARHTWATLAQNHGVPTAVISRSLGHTSETTTRIYLGSMDTRLLARYNRLTTRL